MIYILVDNTSKRVLTASLQDDTVVPETATKVTLDADFSMFAGNPCDFVQQEDGSFISSPIPVDPVQTFNVDLFTTGLRIAFASNPLLFQYYAPIKDMAAAKEFANLKATLDLLVANNLATQADEDAVIAVVAAQGVTL